MSHSIPGYHGINRFVANAFTIETIERQDEHGFYYVQALSGRQLQVLAQYAGCGSGEWWVSKCGVGTHHIGSWKLSGSKLLYRVFDGAEYENTLNTLMVTAANSRNGSHVLKELARS